MAFKVRDLMISVVPEGAGVADCGDCTGACSNADTDCPGGCSNADSHFHTDGCFQYLIDPGDLVELQSLLAAAVARVNLIGTEPAVRPRSLGEINELEAKLTRALEDLRAEKAALTRGK